MRHILHPFLPLLLFLVFIPASVLGGAIDFAKAGDKARESRKYEEALKLYTKAIEMGGLSRHNLSIIYFRRGECWSAQRKWSRAEADFAMAVSLNPSHLHFRLYYGNALLEKGDYDGAIAQYQHAMDIDSASVFPYSNLGGVWAQRGDYDKALKYFKRALELSPKQFWLRRQYAEFFFAFGHFDKAEKELKEAIQLSPPKWVHTTPIMLYLTQAKQNKDAKATLETYSADRDLGKWPGPVYALFLGKITPEDFLVKVKGSNPAEHQTLSIQVRKYLGYYYSLKGQKDMAVEMLKWYLDSSGKGTWGYLAALGEYKRLRSAAQ
jgi:tetratricopeptide (TPR) repeat protein